jgi:phosphatidate cytidylyltransferase
MSPAGALQSHVFLFYVEVACILLIVAGAVLSVLRWSLRKDVSAAWTAFRGWLLMLPVLLVVFFLGRQAVIVFVTAVAILGLREFARATGLYRDAVLTGAVYMGSCGLGASSLMPDPTNGKPGSYGLFMALPAFVVAVLLAIPIVRNRAQEQLRLLALAILGFVYFGWMFGHLAFLANAVFAYSYLGYVVLAVELNDVAAYVCGKRFGRKVLRSNISPTKTWEGAAGALVLSMLLPWVLRFTFPHFDARDCICVGLIVGLGGQMGDLVVSVMKRDLGIKDMGRVIVGHGGILDRIDSLIYVAPLFFHYVRYRHGLSAPP